MTGEQLAATVGGSFRNKPLRVGLSAIVRNVPPLYRVGAIVGEDFCFGAALREVEPSDKRNRNLVTTYRQLGKSFDSLARQFGLNPSDRRKITLPTIDPLKIHDPFDEMLVARKRHGTTD